MRHLKALAITVLVVAGLPVLLTGATTAKMPQSPAVIPSSEFTPVAVSEEPPSDPPAAKALTTPAATPSPKMEIIWDNPVSGPSRPTSRPKVSQPAAKARVVVKPTPKPKSKVKPPRAPSTSHAASGRASWYCSAKYPTCHYKYPVGSMVAAACGKLRIAMGGHADRFWRGKIVTVTNRDTGARVTVKLVDWCGSKDKLIDLYYAPMTKLGGSGVLPVTVRW